MVFKDSFAVVKESSLGAGVYVLDIILFAGAPFPPRPAKSRPLQFYSNCIAINTQMSDRERSTSPTNLKLIRNVELSQYLGSCT